MLCGTVAHSVSCIGRTVASVMKNSNAFFIRTDDATTMSPRPPPPRAHKHTQTHNMRRSAVVPTRHYPRRDRGQLRHGGGRGEARARWLARTHPTIRRHLPRSRSPAPRSQRLSPADRRKTRHMFLSVPTFLPRYVCPEPVLVRTKTACCLVYIKTATQQKKKEGVLFSFLRSLHAPGPRARTAQPPPRSCRRR
jgi:hypothetical protein